MRRGLLPVVVVCLLLAFSSPMAAQTKVIIWHPQLEIEFADFFQGVVDRFNASRSDIVLELQTVAGGWGEIREKLITTATGVQEPPTIVWTHTDSNWELEALGFFEPIPQEVIQDLDLFNRFLGYEEWYRNEYGEYTRLPYAMGGGVMYYNKEMLDQAGVAPADLGPSWTEFEAAARKLTRVDADGVIQQAGYDPSDAIPWLWMDMIYQQGGYMWNEDGTANFASPEGVWAAEYIITQLFRHNRSYGQNLLFGQGRAATQYGWPWRYRRWVLEVPDLPIGVVPTPTVTGDMANGYGRMNIEDFFMVFALASPEQKQAAWEFAKFIYTDADVMIQLAQRGGVPVAPELWTDSRIMEHPVNAVMAQTLPHSHYPGEIGVSTGNILTRWLLEVVNQKRGPAEALEQANVEFNALVDADRPLRIRERVSAF